MSAEKERRKDARISVRWPISVLSGDSKIEGETRNISAEGMFIACREPLGINETYRILLSPPQHKAVEITCKVVWSDLYGIDGQKKTYGMGFCFVEVSEKQIHLLREIISSQSP